MRRKTSKILYGSCAFLGLVASTISTSAIAQDAVSAEEADDGIVVTGPRM